MKNLKHLKVFETIDDYQEWGLNPTDLDYMLTDVSDRGWRVRSIFSKKMYQQDSSSKLQMPGFIRLELLPFIEIVISKVYDHNSLWVKNKEISDLYTSDFFRDFIEVLSKRLLESGLFIRKSHIEGPQIRILVNRISDREILD